MAAEPEDSGSSGRSGQHFLGCSSRLTRPRAPSTCAVGPAAFFPGCGDVIGRWCGAGCRLAEVSAALGDWPSCTLLSGSCRLPGLSASWVTSDKCLHFLSLVLLIYRIRGLGLFQHFPKCLLWNPGLGGRYGCHMNKELVVVRSVGNTGSVKSKTSLLARRVWLRG